MADNTPAAETEQEKPLYSARYTRDAQMISNAAILTEESWMKNLGIGVSLVALIGMIVILLQEGDPNWILVAICFIVAMAAGTLANNTQQFTLRRLQNAGVFISPSMTKEELSCEVYVYEDRVVAKGPGAVNNTFAISQAEKFFADEELIILRFPKKNYVLIPRTAMSNSRYLNLIDFFDKRIDK